MSIGANTTADDQFTPGINTHGNFEGKLCASPVIMDVLCIPDNDALLTTVDSQH